MKNNPKITFSIATYNGGALLEKCLKSIRSQNYPKSKIEIIVIDDNSKDNSVKIARKYKAKVIMSGKRDMYISQRIGLHAATGDFFYLVDQDIELRGKNFIRKMLKPHLEDQSLVASFTRAYPRSDQPWVTRFISYHPFQCDPLFEYLTPNVSASKLEDRKGYSVHRFKIGNIPAESRMFYKLELLKKTENWKMDKIFDHDLLIKTVRAGYDRVAYVPSAGIYHHHANNLSQLVNKRARNLTSHYFPYQDTLEYRWIDLSSKRDLLRLIVWVIYANLFLPATIRGFLRFLKHRDIALLMEPVITILTTDKIAWTFLTNKTGRSIIMKFFTSGK